MGGELPLLLRRVAGGGAAGMAVSANEEGAAVWGMKTAQNEIATAMFLMIDTDGDGKISHEELLLHCLEVGMEPNEISVLFSKLDVDGDKLVTAEVDPNSGFSTQPSTNPNMCMQEFSAGFDTYLDHCANLAGLDSLDDAALMPP